MTHALPSFPARLSLAARVLFDAAFAARVQSLAAPEAPAQLPAAPPPKEPAPPPPAPRAVSEEGALTVLALFQREGRLVDFLQQEIESFPDADIGAAARVVHGGCRKALLSHFELARVRTEAEGARITVPAGFEPNAIKLTGDVRGAAPFSGVLRHAGWRVRQAKLPDLAPGHDATVLAPAEVEL